MYAVLPKTPNGVHISQTIPWLSSCKAVAPLLSDLSAWRAPVNAFSIDHVGGWDKRVARTLLWMWHSFPWGKCLDRCDSWSRCYQSSTGQLWGFCAAAPLACGRRELEWRLRSWSKTWKTLLQQLSYKTWVWVCLSLAYRKITQRFSFYMRSLGLAPPAWGSLGLLPPGHSPITSYQSEI